MELMCLLLSSLTLLCYMSTLLDEHISISIIEYWHASSMLIPKFPAVPTSTSLLHNVALKQMVIQILDKFIV